MAELTSIQAYVSLEQRSHEQAFRMFEAQLGKVGLLSPESVAWIRSLRWVPADDGFVYVQNLGWLTTIVDGKELRVRPYALGWTRQVIPALRSDWLEVGLLLETDGLVYPPPDERYLPEVMRPLYGLLTAFLPISEDAPVFLTNELQDGRPLKAWMEDGPDAWQFDLAIASEQVPWPRHPIPAGYSRAALPGGFAIARDGAWPALPWRS